MMKKKLSTLILFFILIGCKFIYSDSWYFPTERGRVASSENGEFVAYVTPAKEKEKPLLEVFQIKYSREVLLWKCTLGNNIAPLEVFVTNEGKHVVTVNDPPSVGYGDYVLAFYGVNGRIRNYSMEEILHLPKNIDDWDLPDSIHISMSSRWWDRYSVKFFDVHNGTAYFCIWLHSFERWSAWVLVGGKEIKVNKEMVRKWNKKARLWSIKRIREKPFSFRGPDAEDTPYVFLSKLRNPKDRKLVEQLLLDRSFDIYGTSTKNGILHRSQSSARRSLGERLLAEWDGRTTDTSCPDHYDEQICYYLGTIDGIITLPCLPRVGDGTLWVYLIPPTATKDNWHRKPPVQRLVASFDKHLFNHYSGEVSKEFLFAIETITPGKYWIKAIWDKAKPHCKEYAEICLTQPGDYQSLDSKIITVEAGKTVDNIIIDCTHEVTDAIS
jgi:hypothetical protein